MANLNKEDAISIEKKYWSYVYTFKCRDCDNTIKAETKYIKKHSGLCRFCVHKGVPFKSAYNHFKDGVSRSNKKRKKLLN